MSGRVFIVFLKANCKSFRFISMLTHAQQGKVIVNSAIYIAIQREKSDSDPQFFTFSFFFIINEPWLYNIFNTIILVFCSCCRYKLRNTKCNHFDSVTYMFIHENIM